MRLSSRSNFFYFQAVLGKILPNNRLPHPWILDPDPPVYVNLRWHVHYLPDIYLLSISSFTFETNKM